MMNEEVKLKPCPFCGGDRLVRSVNGGMLPSYINQDQAMDIYENTPNVITCMLQCSICGAQVEGYAASNKCIDDLYEKAIENCYTKWNRRANDADVVDVVRCKDCKHRDPEDLKCDCGGLERAGCIFSVSDNYFCAHGERKEKM